MMLKRRANCWGRGRRVLATVEQDADSFCGDQEVESALGPLGDGAGLAFPGVSRRSTGPKQSSPASHLQTASTTQLHHKLLFRQLAASAFVGQRHHLLVSLCSLTHGSPGWQHRAADRSLLSVAFSAAPTRIPAAVHISPPIPQHIRRRPHANQERRGPQLHD
ncbi:uncharacterized protein BKA78DRAFT_121162 [Phyllosticta capitalensis]|uniref:uncharacterized protein n=1 Tax=Phyllosticta capitalensis TaxID=121624 RepID=UPI00313068C5